MYSTSKLFAGVAIAFMLTTTGPASAVIVLDQEYSPDPSLSPSGGAIVGQDIRDTVFKMGQTFTVGVTGVLSAIEVRAFKDAAIFENLTLDLRTPDGSLPGPASAILATAVLSAGDIPNSITSFISFDLRGADIAVAAGDFLSFVLSSPSDHRDPASYLITNSGAEGGYSGGDGFLGRGPGGDTFAVTNDLFFRTFVDIPAPAPLAIMALGVLALASARRTHRK